MKAMNVTEMTKQPGIKLLNSKVRNDSFSVTDYKYGNNNDVLITVMIKNDKKVISINKDDLPHRSAVISFMHYAETTSKIIEEHINGLKERV